jgi:Fe-S cluster biogenesis protein NfuA
MAKKIKFMEVSMKEKVENVLSEIRPLLKADGGDVELVDEIDQIMGLATYMTDTEGDQVLFI